MNRQFANAARIATPLESNFTGDRVTPPGLLPGVVQGGPMKIGAYEP